MKKILLAVLAIPTLAYTQTNISLLGTFDYQAAHGSNLSNLWGYTDENGNEYAIVGTEDGVSIVDITNPSSPVEIFYEPGSNTIWREVKTYNDYAYITTEETDGVMIIDLSPLPASTTLPVNYFFGQPGGLFNTVHSLFIDENGVLYIHGSDRGNGGVIFYDIAANPTNPPELGEYDNWYVHDSYARGDTLYAAHISDGFFTIVDISDKMNPVILGLQNTPHNFTHNTWLSSNGQYLFTTDEVTGAFIGAYDVSDPADIHEVDRAQHDPGTGVIPHNTYWMDNYVITSYYRSGVTIHDVTYPNMMVETGHYDTSPMAGDGFNGAWGVYPFFASGKIIVSDMEEGLFILGPTYQRGCYLNGNITDASTLQIIAGASIEILGQSIFDNSNNLGDYGTGILTPGNYNIRYSKPGYFPDTLFNVSLITGNITTEDVQLVPLPNFALTGHISETGTGLPIANAQVQVWDATFNLTTTTDANGDYVINPFYDGTYQVAVGHWGHVTDCSYSGSINAANSSVNIQLDKGYYDDFFFDFNWSVSGDAPRGIWERGEPNGTTQGPSEINPDEDFNLDCGDKAFVTGNVGGGAGTDDVDSSYTILTSPIFDLTSMTNPYIHYTRWFANKFANNPPNDTLEFYLNNGIISARLEFLTVNNFTESQWLSTSVKVTDFITPTANMTFIAKIGDLQLNGGNLVEGGLDYFYVTDGALSIDENNENPVAIYPNPNNGSFEITTNNAIKNITITDLSGRLVEQQSYSTNPTHYNFSGSLADGIYLVNITFANGKLFNQKIVVRK